MRRIIDLSGSASSLSEEPGVFRLRIDKGCLLIAHGTDTEPEEVRIPATEVSVLVLGHRLALSGAVLGFVTANGGAVLALDDRFRPAGLMLPIEGNKAHAHRLRQQIDKLPGLAPKLWKQIVQAKIAAQSELVPDISGWTSRIEDGDPKNVEATAARIYWSKLLGDDFRRHDETDTNVLLNYGYAVLRGLVGRAICASGLHPALGIHHRGWRDTFALADDLMEPARPFIDQVVSSIPERDRKLSKESKRRLLGVLVQEVETDHGSRRLIEAYELTCQSLVRTLESGKIDLELPRFA